MDCIISYFVALYNLYIKIIVTLTVSWMKGCHSLLAGKGNTYKHGQFFQFVCCVEIVYLNVDVVVANIRFITNGQGSVWTPLASPMICTSQWDCGHAICRVATRYVATR
jgi:hypothetical protein